VTSVSRRIRSLLVALAVLAISASVVVAGRTAISTPPRSDQVTQAESSEAPETEASEAPDASEAPEASEAPDASEAAEGSEAPEASGAAVHPDNHGLLVSQAAQGPTPSGFDNHGLYVRTIAQANAGHADSASAGARSKTKH